MDLTAIPAVPMAWDVDVSVPVSPKHPRGRGFVALMLVLSQVATSVTTTVSCRRGGLRCFAVTSATAREMPGSPLMPKQVRTHAVNCTRRPGRPLTARVADRTSGRQGSRSHLAYLSATDTLAGQARSPKKGQGKFHFDVNRARRRQPSRGIKGPVPFPACRTLTGA
jgi:hypothetical protein